MQVCSVSYFPSSPSAFNVISCPHLTTLSSVSTHQSYSLNFSFLDFAEKKHMILLIVKYIGQYDTV